LTVVETGSPSVDTVDERPLVSGAMSSAERSGEAPRPSWAERYAKGQHDEDRQAAFRAFDDAWVAVAELVGATLTWGGIGWLADRWLGTAPVLMSLGFLVGFATGFYLVWGRSTGRIRRPSGRGTRS
jgi:F0F1-type ATP synthase assembly protein I